VSEEHSCGCPFGSPRIAGVWRLQSSRSGPNGQPPERPHLATVASRNAFARLDSSVGESGPHDFARPWRCLRRRAHRTLDTFTSTASRFQRPWRSRYAPPVEAGWTERIIFFCKTEAKFSRQQDWRARCGWWIRRN